MYQASMLAARILAVAVFSLPAMHPIAQSPGVEHPGMGVLGGRVTGTARGAAAEAVGIRPFGPAGPNPPGNDRSGCVWNHDQRS